MRHQYTPVFRDLLTSSLWATATPATRCVWIALMLSADPEGYIPTSIPGLALTARVTIEEAREAVRLLTEPDPDSRTKTDEGRRLREVDHGFFIINFTAWRERAVQEAEKARKRNWAHMNRKRAANDNGHVDASSGSSETLDAPKPKPKPSSSSSLSSELGFEAPVVQQVLKRIPVDYTLSEELVAYAKQSGVKDPERWFAKLKKGPIGGSRGVFPDQLEGYLQDQVPQWRTWEETERAKETAQRAAASAPQTRFGRGGHAPVGPEPNAEQRAYAERHGLDLQGIVDDLVKRNYTTANYQTKELTEVLTRQLVRAHQARQRQRKTA